MKLPIKFNKRFLNFKSFSTSSDPIEILSVQCVNQENMHNLSSIYVDGVFKSTADNRFPASSKAINEIYKKQSILLLDVGTSSGNAISPLLYSLSIKKAFLTDKTLNIKVRKIGGVYFIHNTNHSYSMAASGTLVAYFHSAILLYLSKFLFLVFENGLNLGTLVSIPLYDQSLSQHKHVHFLEYSCFEKWKGEKVDIVIVANLLNRSYFSDPQIKQSIENFISALVDGGCLAIIDNRVSENSSIFKKNGRKLTHYMDVGPGCSVKVLIEGSDFE